MSLKSFKVNCGMVKKSFSPSWLGPAQNAQVAGPKPKLGQRVGFRS